MLNISDISSFFCCLPKNDDYSEISSVHQPSSIIIEKEPLAQEKMNCPTYPNSDDLQKSDLGPGDVLLARKGGSLTSHIIQTGQCIPFLNPMEDRFGDTDLTHVAMWIKHEKSELQLMPQGPGDAEITEARDGIGVMNTALREGTYKVFRAFDRKQGTVAAAAAKIWGESRSIPYSFLGAGRSVFGSSRPGNTWRAHMERLDQDAFMRSAYWDENGAYCSQIGLSAYQATAPALEKPLSGALNSDSRYVSPCQLDHLLKQDPEQFREIGTLRIRPEDVTYRDKGELPE